MDREIPTTEAPAQPVPAPPQPARRPRWRRALAVAAGVAMVPALYAVADATTGGGGGSSTVPATSRGADDTPRTATGTETELEHGVVVEKAHGGATTPSVPEATLPSSPTAPTTPQATTPTTPAQEQEVEHAVPEPGDDHGVDAPGDDHGHDGASAAPLPSGPQSFSSVGGSIVVDAEGGTLSLVSTSPAAGFGTAVQDDGPTRVEVRFGDGRTEWRIRVELAAGGLTSEVTQHG